MHVVNLRLKKCTSCDMEVQRLAGIIISFSTSNFPLQCSTVCDSLTKLVYLLKVEDGYLRRTSSDTVNLETWISVLK